MASFLDLFPAIDSAGVSATKYRLHFLGSMVSDQMSWLCGMATEFAFAIYLLLSVPANAMLSLVLSVQTWMGPLSEQYQKITGPLYAVFPPWTIALVGLGIVGFSLLWSRPASTTGGLFTSEALTRIGTAAAMVVLVVLLAANPFKMMNWVLETAMGLSTDFATKMSGGSPGGDVTVGQMLVDQSIRDPAIALNYGGHAFTADCSNAWSEAMAAGEKFSASSGCFEAKQTEATPLTAFSAAIMWVFPAAPKLMFAVIVLWKSAVHLSLSVLCFVTTPWVGAAKVHHRRGFDRVSDHVARGGAHLLVAVLTSGTAIVLPALFSGLAMSIFRPVLSGEVPVYLQMLTLGVGYAASTVAVLRLSSNSSALVRVLKADTLMTLEATLGLNPKKLGLRDFRVFKFNPFGMARDSGADPDSSGKAAKLSFDGAPAGTSDAKGGDVTDSSVSTSDAVKQLSAPALAVAEQLSDSDGARALATASKAATELPATPWLHANRIWQTTVSRVASFVTNNRVGDVYGYFTSDIATHDGRRGPGDIVDADVIDVTYHEDHHDPRQIVRPPRGLNPPQRGLEPPGPSEPGPPDVPPAPMLPEPSDPTGPSLPGGAGQVLAGAPSRSLADGGNVYADWALADVVHTLGATFTTAAPIPTAVAVTYPLPGFTGAASVTSTNVQHGPSVIVVEGVEVHGPAGSSGAVRLAGEPVNDQQWWNRARWRRGGKAVVVDEAIDGPASAAGDDGFTGSGIVSGVNRHPASFMAPMRDFLAADDLLAQKQEVELVNAAMGRVVVAVPPPGDTRLAVRLSSDPDERVVFVHTSEFGDPL
ncbi:MAG: hypothetical protein WAV90_00895 [Gordonia amarae]